VPVDLDLWIDDRKEKAIRALRRAVSATDLEHERPGFGWRVRPAPGSILASPFSAHWDPEPDYFHHWVRDAAVALKVWPEVMAAVPQNETGWWEQAFRDHVAFSLAISDPDRRGPAVNPLKERTVEGNLRFLRPDAELAALHGSAWLEEPRVAADGGPDLERWGRPQDDGPALRASAMISVTDRCPALRSPETDRLIARDLRHIVSVAGRPSVGPWEEEPPRRSTFTQIAEWDALERGATRMPDLAAECRAAAERVAACLEGAVSDDGWRESVEADWQDSATVLALLHADRPQGPFSLSAPRTERTVRSLEALFTSLYPINRRRDVPAIGRWAEDRFFDGNPWFPVTLGFAEYHYRLAALNGDQAARARGDGYMSLIREVAPDTDDLPEQFDRNTGAPVSCPALTWSSVAFIAAAAARQAVADR
jgi:glucoamylase